MLGLMVRLSALDADAASAVRVIGFFDALVEYGAALDVVLRQTAALAECPVGVRTADGHLSERTEPSGTLRHGSPPRGARTSRLPSGDEVWLERDGTPHPLDDLLIERFALAAGVALSHRRRDLADLDDSALLRLAISAGVPEAERLRALDRLGVPATASVPLAAVAGPAAALDALCCELAGKCRAPVGGIEALLLPAPLPDAVTVPAGGRIGVTAAHPAADLPAAWREASTALRFTLPSRHRGPPYPPFEPAVVRFESLGAFAAVADGLSAEQISRVPDVAALDRLAGQPGGEELIRTLEAVAATESLRRAATMLHLHHNSVAYRVARAEQVIGYSVGDPYARSKLMLALVLRRVRASAELF
jgi:hypothetical protein